MIEWTVCGCASVCVSVCVGVLAEQSKPSPKNELRAWFHPLQRWLGSLALGRFSCCSSCLPLPAPACPFALCVWSHWSAAQARFIMGCLLVSTISNNDYWLRLSPVPGRHSPSAPAPLLPNLHLHTQSPVCWQCPVVSCRVLALYITVCARVGLHNAPFSASAVAASWRFSAAASCCSCCCCRCLCWWWWCCCRRQRCRWRMKINIY